MAEERETTKRSKPKFLRTDWHKKIRLGRGVKKNLKWHGAKGRQNKLRLNRKGRMQRPKVGWGAETSVKDFVKGMEMVRVENVKDLESVGKGAGIMIAKVGLKKKNEIVKKANEMKITILNRYPKSQPKAEASSKTESLVGSASQVGSATPETGATKKTGGKK